MNPLWRGLLVFMCWGLVAGHALAEESPVAYYQPENIRRFADALYRQGDYLRAAGEYQRYLFYKPQDADQILLRIAESYRLGGRIDRTIQFLQTVLQEYPRSGVTDVARYEIGYSYFLTGQYGRSLRFLQEAQSAIPEGETRWKAQQLMGLNYLMQKRWDEASRAFYQLGSQELPPDFRQRIETYRQYAETGKRLPTKNPVLAGFLSTIVPGAGKIYAKRARDAVFSMMILGIIGWQAYDGFQRDGTTSVKGWVFGTLTGVFYLGNIYGSVVAAQIHNRQVETELLEEVAAQLP